MIQFDEYSNDVGFTVRAHIVTDETAGMYVLSTSSHELFVPSGAVIVEGTRPNVYDVVSGSDWETMGMSPGAAPDSEDDDFVIGDEDG